jgi:hypothetical protein
LVAFAIVAGGPNLHTALLRGTLIFTLAVPAMAGSLTGFIYQRRAGYETEGDEPAQLANAVGTEDGDDALVATGTADYFDGPLQVKTSPGAVALAAVLGSSILMLSNFLMMAWDGVPGGLPPFMQMPGFGVSNAIAGGAMFMAIGTYVAHLIVRGIGKIGYGAYALAGLAGPLIFTFMFAVIGMGVGSFLLFSQFIVPSIAAMTTYRRFAGLEPKPIHEDIEVSDVRNLVGANHPRRRYGRVVKTSRH